ncbi:MAG: transposase [Lachnospiraceae bacterium]|jgi:REP element-mobilizing transposase RayT|nr:transposase [Lachnospiraceae bacterium]
MQEDLLCRGGACLRPTRKNIRLQGYDYSQNGAYFITICTEDRKALFGEIVVGAGLVSARMELSNAGKMIEDVLVNTTEIFGCILDKYIVMPNHIHCIVMIDRAETSPAPTIGDLVCAFKSKATVEYINGVKSSCYPSFNRRLWQRNYHDRIIRNEAEYLRIWQYIDENPLRWDEDEYYL